MNVQELNLSWLRSQTSIVRQEPVIFALSIKENIRLGKLGATDNEIVRAAQIANAHDFIMALPHVTLFIQRYYSRCFIF